MHSVVPNLTEYVCVVLDSTAVVLEWTGRDWTKLLRIALLCTALHCSALYLTGLDSTVVDLYGPGLCWTEMYLAGRE